MAGYTLAGRLAAADATSSRDYQKSVHYAALTKGNDLSAPTCNDCHGNHGAAPPGVGAIANVCGTCHAVFAQKFATSVHKHDLRQGVRRVPRQPRRAEAVATTMLGADRHGVCATVPQRRRQTTRGRRLPVAMRSDIERLKTGIERSGALIARVRNAGIEVSDQQLALREAVAQAHARAHRDARASSRRRWTPIIADGHEDHRRRRCRRAERRRRAPLPPPRPCALARRHPARRRRARAQAAADRPAREPERTV